MPYIYEYVNPFVYSEQFSALSRRRAQLPGVIYAYLRSCAWFGGRSIHIRVCRCLRYYRSNKNQTVILLFICSDSLVYIRELNNGHVIGRERKGSFQRAVVLAAKVTLGAH